MQKGTNFQPIFDYIDKNNATIAKVVEARFEENNLTLAKIIEERFKQNNGEFWQKMQEHFSDKKDIRAINDRLDGITKLVRKLDEERLFSVEWLRRIESEVERIKKHLQIV